MRTIPAALAVLLVAGVLAGATPTYYNGLASYAPANGYDAPIFREFSFAEGIAFQYHVLSQEAFPTDARQSKIYQFPGCTTLQPVLQRLPPIPGHPIGATDSPTRRIVDAVLTTACRVQPTSEADVLALALQVVEYPFFVNAPEIPAALADLPDHRLYNGPPYRPRIDAWRDGERVRFITYEASWMAQYVGTVWPDGDAEVHILSYGPVFRPGFTIFNVAAGSPLTPSFRSYSPIWRGVCIVDADNPKCMVSVNMWDPAYYQCRSIAACLRMENSRGHPVEAIAPNTFTHIDCPMVAVDVDGNNYIDASEEIQFPDLWVDGPIVVGQPI